MTDKSDLADMPVSKVLTLTGFQTVCFAFIGAALWVIGDRSLESLVSFRAWEIGYGVALAGALIAFGMVLTRLFPDYADWLVRSQVRNYPFLKKRLSMPAIIFISICAGVGEEALFRGGVQVLLGDYMPMALAILTASTLFAAIHFAQPAISAIILVIGAIFGVFYWQTGSLLMVMIGHAIYDIYALWALQEGMHRLQVFGAVEDQAEPSG